VSRTGKLEAKSGAFESSFVTGLDLSEFDSSNGLPKKKRANDAGSIQSTMTPLWGRKGNTVLFDTSHGAGFRDGKKGENVQHDILHQLLVSPIKSTLAYCSDMRPVMNQPADVD
jgi:hypothetical protein